MKLLFSAGTHKHQNNAWWDWRGREASWWAALKWPFCCNSRGGDSSAATDSDECRCEISRRLQHFSIPSWHLHYWSSALRSFYVFFLSSSLHCDIIFMPFPSKFSLPQYKKTKAHFLLTFFFLLSFTMQVLRLQTVWEILSTILAVVLLGTFRFFFCLAGFLLLGYFQFLILQVFKISGFPDKQFS